MPLGNGQFGIIPSGKCQLAGRFEDFFKSGIENFGVEFGIFPRFYGQKTLLDSPFFGNENDTSKFPTIVVIVYFAFNGAGIFAACLVFNGEKITLALPYEFHNGVGMQRNELLKFSLSKWSEPESIKFSV